MTEKQIVIFRAVNSVGQVIWTKKSGLEKGWNAIPLQVPAASEKIVVIQVTGAGFSLSKKLITR